MPEAILEYRLNNNYEDSSPNGFDGIGNNGVFIDDYLGNEESALSLNGVDTYVDFPEIPQLEPDFPITIAVRARFDVMDQTQVLFTTDFAELHHSGVWMQVAAEDRLAAAFGTAANGFNGPGRRGFFTDNTFEADTWYSIVAVFTGPNDIRIYVDCELQEGFYTGSAIDIGYTEQAGSLGRKRANPETILPPYYFEGDLDEFRMWDVELTEEQILAVCQASPYDCPDFEANIGDPCEINGEQGTLDEFCECLTPLEFDVAIDGECPGDEFIFELTDVTDASQIESAEWNISGYGNFTGDPISIVIDDAGTYTWEVIVTSVSGDEITLSGSFDVIDVPNPENIDMPDEVELCPGEDFTLDFAPYLDDWTSVLDEDGNEVTVFETDMAGVYFFTFSTSCLTVEREIEVITFPDYNLESPSAACVNSNVEISLIPEIDSEAEDIDLTIDWGDGAPIENFDGQSTSHTYQSTGGFDIAVSGVLNDCPIDLSNTVEVQTQPELNLPDTVIRCFDDIFEFDFSGLDFQVTDESGFQIDFFETTSSGNYTFTAENFCGADEETIAIIFEEIDPNQLNFPNTICEGVDTISIGFEEAAYNFQWSNGSEAPNIDVTEAGNYTVLVSSGGSCSRDYSFTVAPQAPVDLSQFPDETVKLCTEGNRNIILPYFGFEYTFPDGSAGQEYFIEESQLLEIAFSDGCYDYDVEIEIELYDCLCPIYIPNAFTPNGDGLNDIFKVAADCPVETFHLLIFNRWGNLIFESKDIDRGWNGHSPNTDFYASHGVYFYIVKYTQLLDGVLMPEELTGHVTLLR
ncbi:MAG: gliding motility-associated C-terminal domain-containing protein [Cryomorphaceae bacterium]|nr:gliding motility-associated C-terminal domain-containing protein [Flavobacteriales bacterium]